MSGLVLSNFCRVDPLFECSHEESQRFLESVHEASQHLRGGDLPLQKMISRYGLKATQVASRRAECEDVKLKSENRRIYSIDASRAHGAPIETRMEFYERRVQAVVAELYPPEGKAPDHLLHVTCTGYVAPSPIQKLVAANGWPRTTCTNVYHMGCFAALPAVRIAMGQVSLFGGRASILHNEICSLHLDPAAHTPEQLVVQSLFADGHIKYDLSMDAPGPGFEVLTVHERVIPNTEALMTWSPASWGMRMSLDREVPAKIAGHLSTFLEELLERAQLPKARVMEEGIFAVHPGGPKIIDLVAEALALKAPQVESSREVLLHRGNMSSATLPHIWQRILGANPPAGTPVVSFAFGPGLTIFGTVFLVRA